MAIGLVIASAFVFSGPQRTSNGKVSSSPTTQEQRPGTNQYSADNEFGGPHGKRPPRLPNDAELRDVMITREYERRLAAMAQRTAVPFHGVPSSDYTGNGTPDIMVTKPMATNLLDGTDPAGGFGAVEVWTLWSATPVLTLNGSAQNDLFGLSAKSAGDLDGDGADDIVVGAMLEHGSTGLEGVVEVYSGSDGALLFALYGLEWEYFGRTVAGVSDADGDGQWDIASSSWVYDQDNQPSGMVSIHSGSDGALIRTFTSDLINDGFGYEIISMGDIDGDAASEVAVSATLAPGDPRAFAPAIGRLHIYHGGPRAAQPEHLNGDDADLIIYNVDPLIDYFGVAVELTADEDADGVQDLLVTSILDPDTPEETTALQIYSSVTGAMIWPVSTPPPGSGSGRDGDSDDEQFPAVDENGNIIHYGHYTSGLGVFGDTTRDLRVEQADMSLVVEAFGQPSIPGNPVSGDVSLSGEIDLNDLGAVAGSMNQSSVVLEYVEDTHQLLTRWSALDPYQYGDYVTGGPGRDLSREQSGRSDPSDPVYPFPRPGFPGYDSVSTIKDFGTHPTCPGCDNCELCCLPGTGCGGVWDDNSGGPISEPDANGNGIPDAVDCSQGGTPTPTEACPYPCSDDDRDGIPNQQDCDSPCYDNRYLPPGSDGLTCILCEDDDCDGISNQNDCDSDCYQGDNQQDCACQDDDNDGIKNQNDLDSECYESAWKLDLDIDSDNDDGIDIPSRSDAEDVAEDDYEADNKLIPINMIDGDIDGIVDFADGFNLNGIDGDSDDVIDPDDGDGIGFTPLVLELQVPEGCADGVAVSFSYSASDPSQISYDDNGNPELPSGGLFRIWTKDATEARNPLSLSGQDEAGDYVEPGLHPIGNFEFDEQGVAILYVEAVRIDDTGPSLPIHVEVTSPSGHTFTDAVRVRTFEMQSVIFDEVTGEVEPAPVILEPADLQPELWLTSVNAELLSYSTMQITVEGVVRDRLSELTLNWDQQLQYLNFYVEGHLSHTLDNLPDLTVTEPIAPWQLATLEVPFSVTFEYDAPTGHFGAGGVPIDVMTSINAAGQNNRVSTFVGVNWLDIDWITGESLSPLPGFVGGRTPLELEFPDRVGEEPGVSAAIGLSYNGTSADATLEVTAGGLGTYQGDFTVLGATSNVFLNAVGDRLLDPNEPDVLFFDAAYSGLDGEPRSHRLMFTESGNDTAHFVQELNREFELAFTGSSSATGDTASVRYAGGNAPWTDLIEPDGVLDSSSLHGDPAQLGYNGEDLRLDIGADLVLNPSAPDVLTAPLVLSSGAGEIAIATQWVETGANSGLFRASSGGLVNHPDRIPWAIRNTPYESHGFIPVIGYLPEFTEPDEESFPSLNRIVQRISGLGDNVDPSILGISDTFDVAPVEAHAYSPYRYYSIRIKNNNQIAVYFFTTKTLPPGLDEAKLKTGFDDSVHEAFMRVRPSDRDTYGLKIIRATANNLGQLENVPHPVGEEQEITVDSIFDWCMFLLNEDGPGVQDKNAAFELLTTYAVQGGVVRIENIDKKFDLDLSPGGGHTALIRIDPRYVDDPAEAAGLLHEALIKVVEDKDFPLISGAEIGTFKKLLKSRWNRVHDTVSAGANLYIEGVTLFMPGGDWGLLINDVLEGDIGWETAINFLPFAKSALKNKSTRNRIRLCPGGAATLSGDCDGFPFTEALCQKVSDAKKMHGFPQRLNHLKNDIPGMKFEERRGLVTKILRPTIKRTGRLRRGMTQALPNIDPEDLKKYTAHHMLPFHLRSRFAAWALDVDDYRGGQGVFLHNSLHNGKPTWHDEFNGAWVEILNDVDRRSKLGEITFEQGHQLLLNHLQTTAFQKVQDVIGDSGLDNPAIWP